MLYDDAQRIIKNALAAAQPDTAVAKALMDAKFADGRVILVAIGKAAWQMAHKACDILGDKVSDGVVITKYDHAKGSIPRVKVFEAGHPVPDENSFLATEAAISAVENLHRDDTVLFLVSGGGSALFEKPLIAARELENLTEELLRCGADIVAINTLRKRLSAVKGGRFAKLCEPAQVLSIILSDIIGDPLDMIASGPTYMDSSTSEQAFSIIKKYNICISKEISLLMQTETPKELGNITTKITGSVSQLCHAACAACLALDYQPIILTTSLCCTARDAGSFLSSIAQYHAGLGQKTAFLAGGETIVKVTGTGKGGRNQEIALAAADGISGIKNVAVFSFGSDGTDGPTDAAGGYADGFTKNKLIEKGIDIHEILADNDSYSALNAVGGLIKTGPTGTNVNDLSVVLIN